MSHFNVMVIGLEPEKQLAPYHEFECTGVNDEYIQEIDRTEELQSGYDTAKRDYYKTGPGEYVVDYEATDEEKEQGTLETLPIKQFMSMREYLEDEGFEPEQILTEKALPSLNGVHKYGYARMEGDKLIKAVCRTNPRAKWDWYQLGGRWSGYLLLKPEFSEAVKQVRAFESMGKPVSDSLRAKIEGIAMGERSWFNEKTHINKSYVDQAPKGKIDFERMVQEHLERRMPFFDEIQSVINGREWEDWDSVRTRICGENSMENIDEARAFFNSQPVVEDLKKVEAIRQSFMTPWSDFKMSREAYEARERITAIATFAYVMDSQWHQSGEMGWFGMSSNEKEPLAWGDQFLSMLNSLSDDTLISVYDCHI